MKKEILLVTTSFPGLLPETNHLGGGMFLLREVQSLVYQGYAVRVIMPALRGASSFESEQGIEIERFHYPLERHNPGYNGKPQHGKLGVLEKISQVFMALFLVFRVARRVSRRRYWFLWSNWLQVGFLSSLGNFGRLPHLVSVRGSDIRESSEFSVRLMARCTPNLLNMYPDDPEIASWVKKYSFSEIKVPGVYMERNIVRENSEGKILTVIGRLDGEESSLRLKGLGDELFIMIEKVLNERSDFSVVVVGDGTRAHYYRKQMSSYAGRVIFRGWQSEFDQDLSRASVVIGGSGMNGVIMDTVPYGVPVLISKNLTGTLWKDGVNCLIYDPHDVDQWASAVHVALNEVDLVQAYANQAKLDLKEFALPQKSAGSLWESSINSFCKSRGKFFR